MSPAVTLTVGIASGVVALVSVVYLAGGGFVKRVLAPPASSRAGRHVGAGDARATDSPPSGRRRGKPAERAMPGPLSVNSSAPATPPYSWGSDQELYMALFRADLAELPTADPVATFPAGMPAAVREEWS
jgi:hypothetical protein